MPDKKEIINHLNEIADMLEFKGENPFKIKAYRSGAEHIRKLEDDLSELIKRKELNHISGIGKSLQSIIYEFFEKGESTLHSQLRGEVPDGIEQLLKVKGLTPKRIKLLNSELGITNLIELEQAAKENHLKTLKGFGESFQEKIIKEIGNFKVNSKFVLLNTAEKFASEVEEKLNSLKLISKYQLTGELRRGMEIISSIEFVLLVSDIKIFLKELKKKFNFSGKGNTILIDEYFEIPVTFHLTLTKKEFIGTLFFTTGSSEFINRLNIDSSKAEASDEEGIFKKIHAPYVIPEMREKEYFEVRNETLKENPDLSLEQFKGLLHFHTTYSDGRDTLSSMIKAAAERGFEFLCVTDHSKSAYYAKGLNENQILLQKQELIKISSNYKLHLYQGIESDILADGSLDYSQDLLNEFDFVIASIHSRFNMDEKEMTKRMIKAIENPVTDLLAHPSGRMLLSRAPYKFNVKKIIDACVSNNVAIEINSNPRRLDIDWRWIYYAREKEALFSINPDAHSVEEINLLKYGIKMARKGGIQPSEVINCFTPAKFKKYLKRKINRVI